MTALVALDDLTLGYDRHPAVHHLAGTIAEGELLAVVGPNGGGKSTLLKGIMGELKPMGGRLERRIPRREIAYMPQRAMLDTDFPISVADVIATGLWRRCGAWRRVGRRGRERVAEALGRVGLSGFERRSIGTLSRGQLQRALFARLIVQDARLALLDEPFTAVDPATTVQLLQLVREMNRAGTAFVAVLHDLDQVRDHFTATLLLAREAVAWGPTVDVLGRDNLDAARRLSEAWDEDAARCLWERAA